jgi:hypothetical protein
VVPVAKSDIGKYKIFSIVSRLDLHTKNNYTVTVSRLIFAKQKRLHWNCTKNGYTVTVLRLIFAQQNGYKNTSAKS